MYVRTNVPGPGCDRELFSEHYVGCSCEGTCDEVTCSCIKYFGYAYRTNGRLAENFVAQQSQTKPILECGEECTCGELCANRVVQKGPSASLTVFYTKQKGFGLKTTKAMLQHSFVCEYAGEILGADEAKRRLMVSDECGKSNYLIALREHSSSSELCTYIDPEFIGNLGRFINHSCDPNLIMVPVRVSHSIPRLALFSRRDLLVDEELTFDYSGRSTFTNASGPIGSSNACGSARHTVVEGSEDWVCGKKLKLESPIEDYERDTTTRKTGLSFTPQEKPPKICLCGSSNCAKVLPFDEFLCN